MSRSSTIEMPAATLSRSQPYTGLRPFDEADADWFFGRSAEINELLKRLRRLHFVAIVGASGSGKSSLIRAGVLPQIRDGFLDDQWTIATLRPGEEPLANLAAALATADADRILRDSPSGLVRLAQHMQRQSPGRLLVLVDQFEELFQFGQRRGDAAQEEIKQFLKLLLTAAASNDAAVYVVITMRLEWLNECAIYPGLAEAINGGIYLVPQMQRRQFSQAVLGPLEAADGSLTAALLDRMLNDLDNRSDQLPVLQHALLRLWQRSGAGTPFDLQAYEAIGTFSHCLSNHAEEVYGELSGDDKDLAERIFRLITQVNKGRKARRPRAVSELLQATGSILPQMASVIAIFQKPGRFFLVTTQGALRPESIVDISHEALIRQWDRLGKWVEHEAELQGRLRRLTEDAAEWNLNRRHSGACLYTGSRLARVEDLQPLLEPSSVPAAFLKESSRVSFRQQVLRRSWIGLAVLLAIGVALGLAFVSAEHARASRALAEAAQAQRERAEAEANVASLQARKAQEFQTNLVQQIEAAKGSSTALAAIARSIQANRVYIQYAQGNVRVARSAQTDLQAHGFVIPSTEPMSQDRTAGQTQVHYFHEADRPGALRIAGLLRSLVPGGVATQAVANPKGVVPAGQFELWVASPPAPVATANVEPPRPQPADTTPKPTDIRPAAPAPGLTASLSQDRIIQGHGVVLSWRSENANTVLLEGIGQVEPSGSITLTPQSSTVYRLTAKGDGGSVNKAVAVEVAAAAPVAPAPAPAAVVVPSPTLEASLVRTALNRWKEAYESESIDELKRIWPTMNRNQEKGLRTAFDQFNAIRLTLACREDSIHVEGDTATATCQQSAVYTLKGQRQPEQNTSTGFKLRRVNNIWLIDTVR